MQICFLYALHIQLNIFYPGQISSYAVCVWHRPYWKVWNEISEKPRECILGQGAEIFHTEIILQGRLLSQCNQNRSDPNIKQNLTCSPGHWIIAEKAKLRRGQINVQSIGTPVHRGFIMIYLGTVLRTQSPYAEGQQVKSIRSFFSTRDFAAFSKATNDP